MMRLAKRCRLPISADVQFAHSMRVWTLCVHPGVPKSKKMGIMTEMGELYGIISPLVLDDSQRTIITPTQIRRLPWTRKVN